MAAGGMIVIGSSRSGKTTLIKEYEARLKADGFRSMWFDDKDYLMAEAMEDMKGMDWRHGRIETERTVILNPEMAFTQPRRLQLIFKDGRLLNTAHVKIMRDIGDALRSEDSRLVVLGDLAYGKDVDFGRGKEPLRQSGRQFVKWFWENGMLTRNNLRICEITAPFRVRAERNEKSEERIETKEFKDLFPDIGSDGRGFFMLERMILGSKLRHIDNGTIKEDEYVSIIHRDYQNNFLPVIRGEGVRMSQESKIPSRWQR